MTSDDLLHGTLEGRTPTTVPGATTVRTDELVKLLADRNPLVIDTMWHSWYLSLPGAIGLNNSDVGGDLHDPTQKRLERKMHELTGGDLTRPLVAVGFNSENFGGRNLALRLLALGYTNVFWYRGGREAWEVAGLPETEVRPADW